MTTPLMNAVAGSHPSVSAALAPSALQALPFHLATWSACAMPAMFTESLPM